MANTISTGLEGRAGITGNHEQERPSFERSGYSFPPAHDDLEGWTYVLSEMPSLERSLCRVDDGVPDRAHRLKALGNAVVWPQAVRAFEELRARIR